ncbi:uroporphyrinogen-III synthase [Buchnera aphidicola (Kurisakia onigurumii)]|uniref:uroporphyrinogen-III synthase n=1 Tax=Buchnera aphidicola TaxID=9 RepID=UPI0031B67038
MNILIVRPILDAKILMKKFLKKGIKSHIFPIISFKKGKEINILPKIIKNLPQKSIIIFVSKQAIKYTLSILQEKKIKFPKKLYFYTIGYHSSLILKKYVPYPVKYPKKKENSEELLKILILKKNIKKKKY